MFQNSPNLNLLQEDLLSLEKFIFNQQHLQNNIGRLEFEVIAKWRVYVRLHVKNAKLWEGARPYIWKHLGGDNYWTRQNGTEIKLSRIHVK